MMVVQAGIPSGGAEFAVGDRGLDGPAHVHPDWCTGYGQVGAYAVVGASAIGHLHLRDGLRREDAFAVRSAGRWLATAVADGVGSQKLSRYGSSICVNALCGELLRGLDGPTVEIELGPGRQSLRRARVPSGGGDDWRSLLSPLASESKIVELQQRAQHAGTLAWSRPVNSLSSHQQETSDAEPFDLKSHVTDAFCAARSHLKRFAIEWELDLRELACTLLGLVIDTTTGRIACGQVGDGLVTALHCMGRANPLLDAPIPEGGGVYSITDRDWRRHFAVADLGGDESSTISSIMLMTDGISDDYLYPQKEEDLLSRWCTDMDADMRKVDPPHASLRLLHWLASEERAASFDDRTLLAVLRQDQPAHVPVGPASQPAAKESTPAAANADEHGRPKGRSSLED